MNTGKQMKNTRAILLDAASSLCKHGNEEAMYYLLFDMASRGMFDFPHNIIGE